MSLQRAYVNCERCYELAQPYIEASKILDRVCILRNNHIYQARNDAMKALERVLDQEEVDSALTGEINQALADCADCDFKKAYVAHWTNEMYMEEIVKDLETKNNS